MTLTLICWILMTSKRHTGARGPLRITVVPAR